MQTPAFFQFLLISSLLLLGGIFFWQCTSTKKAHDSLTPVAQYELSHTAGWHWVKRSFPVGDKGKEYILRFDSEGGLNLSLDINNCFGNYTLAEGGKISIPETIGCTEACCDQPGALAFVEQLSQSDHYQIKGDTLVLSKGENALFFQAITLQEEDK